jgi:hypothetical protein
MTAIPVDQTPASQPTEPLEERFGRLADTWHRASAHHSSGAIRYNHPAYQAIIALGRPVVPLLLRDLERTRRHWFVALKAVTGADPVSPADAGRVARMTEAWLRWGRENGYQWSMTWRLYFPGSGVRGTRSAVRGTGRTTASPGQPRTRRLGGGRVTREWSGGRPASRTRRRCPPFSGVCLSRLRFVPGRGAGGRFRENRLVC